MSSISFAELGCSRAVTDALTARGATEPFAIQRLVIPDVLDGRDVLAKSPTGSGKTLAFIAPLADRLQADGPRGAALVLAPTRELAQQIVEEAREIVHARALSICAVYGGAGIVRQAKLAARAHIIVATPGRLLDLMGRGDVRLDRVRVLVLDEADRMLDMGFRPAVDRIVAATPDSRQTLFFSATLEGEAGKIAAAYTRSAARHEHTPASTSTARVEHRFLGIAPEEKVPALVRELRGELHERTLVFVRTRHGADRLVKRLRTHALEAVAMHGAKSQPQRERALASFERGEVATLVATDVAARGIDVEGITHVINFDAPADREAYVHRVGRTGRAGRAGTGTTFVLETEVADVGRIAHALDLGSELEAAGIASPGAPRPSSSARGRSRAGRHGATAGPAGRGRRGRSRSAGR
jgi:ATP-dependent RNA helicase RhlE